MARDDAESAVASWHVAAASAVVLTQPDVYVMDLRICIAELDRKGETVVSIDPLDSVPLNDKFLPRRLPMRETLPWNPHQNSMLGLYPYRCGKYLMPISSRGTVASGFMLSNESKGFHVRFDNPCKVKTVSFPRKSYMAKVRSRSIGMELGCYSHPSLHRNLYLLKT